MNSICLSLLIPTVPSRSSKLQRLLENIEGNRGEKTEGVDYEVVVLSTPEYRNGGESTGAKRNALLASARGDYVWFIDDDDLLMNNSLSAVIDLCRSEQKDMVATCGKYTVNGAREIRWFIRKDYGNITVKGPNGEQIFHRSPNHITPVRRELAIKCTFPDMCNAEDKAYSEQLVPLLETECILDTPAYHYDFSTVDKLYK